MSFDLEILVEGGKSIKPMIIENIRIEVNSRYGGRHCYTDTFSYMAEKRGAWCSLFELDTDNRIFSAFNIADIDISVPEDDKVYPFWTDRTSGMYILRFKPGYYRSFRAVMKKLLSLSPKKRIMFLPRLQGGEYNNVCGVLTLKQFFKLLNNKKILFNIAYIIQEEAEMD